jgi:hypothetical protein
MKTEIFELLNYFVVSVTFFNFINFFDLFKCVSQKQKIINFASSQNIYILLVYFQELFFAVVSLSVHKL